jgi:hypothetical protein
VRLAKESGIFEGVAAVPELPEEPRCGAPHCELPGTMICSRCKGVRYCSSMCQASHWRSGHKAVCSAMVPPSVMEKPVFGEPERFLTSRR